MQGSIPGRGFQRLNHWTIKVPERPSRTNDIRLIGALIRMMSQKKWWDIHNNPISCACKQVIQSRTSKHPLLTLGRLTHRSQKVQSSPPTCYCIFRPHSLEMGSVSSWNLAWKHPIWLQFINLQFNPITNFMHAGKNGRDHVKNGRDLSRT